MQCGTQTRTRTKTQVTRTLETSGFKATKGGPLVPNSWLHEILWERSEEFTRFTRTHPLIAAALSYTYVGSLLCLHFACCGYF